MLSSFVVYHYKQRVHQMSQDDENNTADDVKPQVGNLGEKIAG